jgi:hypothetical protein
MPMRALLLLLAALFVSISPAFADEGKNLLKNGDFSSGISEWEGDCHTPSQTSGDATPTLGDISSPAAAPAAGVVVKLRGHDWTQMKQDFDGKIGEYTMTIVYSLSPDLKFSTSLDDYANIPASTGYSLFRAFSSPPGKWIIIVSDVGAARFTYWTVNSQGAAGQPQTFKSHVHLGSDDSSAKAICLVFPPGSGTVTLQNISIVPASGGGDL